MESASNAVGAARLHAGLVRREGQPQLLRFKPRAFGRKLETAPAPGKLARFRALLGTPGARLFITTYSSTFVFVLGMSG